MLISELNNISYIAIGSNYEHDIIALTYDGTVLSIKQTNRWYVKPFYTMDDKIQQISTSHNHMLLLNFTGQVYVYRKNYGYGNDIELLHDLNNIVSISAGSHHSLALTSDGEIYMFGKNASIPYIIPNLKGIVQISAHTSWNHNISYISVVLTSDGKVINIKSDGSNYISAYNICEIYFNGDTLIQRTNNDEIIIDTRLLNTITFKLPK